MDHYLKASTQTCIWGYFDALCEPVLTINSGDIVTIDSVSGGPNVIPPKEFYTPPELKEIHALGVPQVPGHILTGPVEVKGAKRGQVLAVTILEVHLRQDWGYNFIRPLSGALPYDFNEEIHMHRYIIVNFYIFKHHKLIKG